MWLVGAVLTCSDTSLIYTMCDDDGGINKETGDRLACTNTGVRGAGGGNDRVLIRKV